MCVNFRPPKQQQIVETFGAYLPESAMWPEETWQDYAAPIIRSDANGKRAAGIAAYSMVPKQHIPPGVKRFSTMNARSETIGSLRSYASAWKAGQVCLVPMICFFEPCYESGSAVRWGIGMADDSPFAVAGIWRSWKEADGATSLAFSQITISADGHPLMNRFHKPDDEKRSLVIIPPEEYDAWLQCRNPEMARSFLRDYPAQKMKAWPAPTSHQKTHQKKIQPVQEQLF